MGKATVRDNVHPPMVLGSFTWLYRKLGRIYPSAFVTVEFHTAFVIALGTIALFSFYYEGTKDEFLTILLISVGLTAIAVWGNLYRTYPRLRPIEKWIAGRRSEQDALAAWTTAISLPLELIRRDFLVPVLLVVVPTCVSAVAILDADWYAFFPLFAAGLIALGYSGILHYLALEAGMRPVLVDINHSLPPRMQTDCAAIPLRVRLMAALPLINLITGLAVAALTSEGGGGADLGVDVLIAVAVATTISLELTVMLSKSVLRPLADLRKATDALAEGRYDVTVPVTTGDELGELAASFNHMVAGLAERERIREAFGTYLDREVAEYILSEGFTEEGAEIEVSILFCDVRDFTSFAATARAHQVVGELNRLFDVVVPVIHDHGGHVDKFEGDGLLAVFGAPEPYRDHADRAVRAACEIARRVNDGEGGRLRLGIGVNSGRVVAGSIGGAGRLNFSVIGDPVNVAARVEAATRRTGDDILITTETMKRLGPEFETEPRGPLPLKGVADPMRLHAPRRRGGPPAAPTGGDVPRRGQAERPAAA